MHSTRKDKINGYTLETYFKRIIDKKKICEVQRLKDESWQAKDTFRCRNAWYEDNGDKFIIVRLDFTRRLILTDWEAWFDKDKNTLCVRKGSWKLVCPLDAADVKWIEMRLH